ncbi:MAG: nuclear transport factor 2 family protein [Geobacteraceae bacterium]|nr:nuclear transport factor 2 family protein [Geobacteraceae bacterium]
MTSIRQKEMVESYIGAYNSFDVEAMLEFVHRDVVFENVTGGEVNATVTGIHEFRKLSERAKSFYSARREQITGLESVGDTTTVDISFEGMLAVDLPNGMKAGDIHKLTGRSVYEFLDAKICRITDYS